MIWLTVGVFLGASFMCAVLAYLLRRYENRGS